MSRERNYGVVGQLADAWAEQDRLRRAYARQRKEVQDSKHALRESEHRVDALASQVAESDVPGLQVARAIAKALEVPLRFQAILLLRRAVYRAMARGRAASFGKAGNLPGDGAGSSDVEDRGSDDNEAS